MTDNAVLIENRPRIYCRRCRDGRLFLRGGSAPAEEGKQNEYPSCSHNVSALTQAAVSSVYAFVTRYATDLPMRPRLGVALME